MTIKRMLILINEVLLLFGIDLLKMALVIRGLPAYFCDLKSFRKSRASSRQGNLFRTGRLYPCLADRFSQSGVAKGHYFHQDLLVARRIMANRPQLHVDIGSRIDGFVAHIASWRKIKVLDIRPLGSEIPNVEFIQADLAREIDKKLINYCDSLSCLHAIEHFGLGRYGDQIDYEGHLHGLSNISKILQKGGKFYLSTPIGPQRIEFNAHRVFSMKYLVELFGSDYRIDYFSFVDDNGELYENVELENSRVNRNFGCEYGCGIFEMTKLT